MTISATNVLADESVIPRTLNSSKPGALIRPPQHLADRELWGVPKSAADELRMERARAEAQDLFDRSRRIEERALEDLFPGISTYRCNLQAAVLPLNGIGNVQPYELVVISTICNYLNPDLVFEFGTFNGLTTLHFALNSHPSAKIVTIDLAPDDTRRQVVNDDTYYIKDNSVGGVFQALPERDRIQQIFGDTTAFDQSVYKGKADLIFIDAGHEYELVRSDTEKALDMLAPGGVILWHDYVFSHYGVYTWLNELSRSIPLFAVPKASLVAHQNLDPGTEVAAIMAKVDAQAASQRCEETARIEETRRNRTAIQRRKLRNNLVPAGSRRERVVRYLFR